MKVANDALLNKKRDTVDGIDNHKAAGHGRPVSEELVSEKYACEPRGVVERVADARRASWKRFCWVGGHGMGHRHEAIHAMTKKRHTPARKATPNEFSIITSSPKSQ